MQDLAIIYAKKSNPPTFHNFFKTCAFKNAQRYLKEELQLPDASILIRTHPSRGKPAQCLAHDLITLAFLYWLDPDDYHRAILRILA